MAAQRMEKQKQSIKKRHQKKISMIPQPWEPSEIKRLIDMWNLGGFSAEIVPMFPGRTRSSLLGKLKRLREDECYAAFLTRPPDRSKSHKGWKRRA